MIEKKPCIHCPTNIFTSGKLLVNIGIPSLAIYTITSAWASQLVAGAIHTIRSLIF